MKILLSAVLFVAAAGSIAADAFPPIPSSFWGVGPSIGYTGNSTYGGFSLGAEAVHSFFYVFSASAGYRFVHSRSEDTPGMSSIHTELTVALPLVLGFGINYNWLHGIDRSIGVQAYFGAAFPLHRNMYFSIFYRPSWVHFAGGREIFHEWGIYAKYSNFVQKAEEASQARQRRRLDAMEAQLDEDTAPEHRPDN